MRVKCMFSDDTVSATKTNMDHYFSDWKSVRRSVGLMIDSNMDVNNTRTQTQSGDVCSSNGEVQTVVGRVGLSMVAHYENMTKEPTSICDKTAEVKRSA